MRSTNHDEDCDSPLNSLDETTMAMTPKADHAKSAGIIGVGLIGSVIAKRLISQGFRVFGFDPISPEIPELSKCNSAAEVCNLTDTVILSLPTSQVAQEVIRSALQFLGPSHTVIDTTTGDALDAQRNQSLLDEKRANLVEATIAGSSDLLSKGEAPLFVGGKKTTIDKVSNILSALSPYQHYAGEIGSASHLKLVFNLTLGLQRAVLAEALLFGESLGFEREQTLHILMNSPAGSQVMETKGKRMVERNYVPPQARLKQHLKDVHLILKEAERQGIRLPLSETHRELMEMCVTLGFGDQDTSAIAEAFRP